MADSAPETSLRKFGESEIAFQSMEPWAILGLILGLLSAAAMIAPILWLLPLFGVLTSVVALRRIRLEAGRMGRTAALVGLGLSAFFGVAPVARAAAAWVMLSEQARPMADQFFEYLRQDSPEKALMLQFTPDARQPLDDMLWVFYRNDSEGKAQLKRFVSHSLVRTLLALGKKADVRFYKTHTVATDGTRAQVDYWYTVTWSDESGKKTTLLAGILMERKPPADPGRNPWKVKDFTGGINPSQVRQ
jgi:hypothetical protein